MDRSFHAHVRVCATTVDPMGDSSPRRSPSPGPASPTPGPSTATATKSSLPMAVAAGNPPSIDLPPSTPSRTSFDLDSLLDIDVPPLATSDSLMAPIELGSLDDFIDFAALDKVLN